MHDAAGPLDFPKTRFFGCAAPTCRIVGRDVASPAEAEGFGLLKTDKDGSIVEFKEKPTGDALDSMRVDTTRFGLKTDDAVARPYLASASRYYLRADSVARARA